MNHTGWPDLRHRPSPDTREWDRLYLNSMLWTMVTPPKIIWMWLTEEGIGKKGAVAETHWPAPVCIDASLDSLTKPREQKSQGSGSFSSTGMMGHLKKVNSFVLKEEVAAIQMPRNRIHLSLNIHCTVFIEAYYRLKESKDTQMSTLHRKEDM